MASGVVTSEREAIVSLFISAEPSEDGADGITAVVDTGFNDFLTLSVDAAERLRLTDEYAVDVTLADGSSIALPTYLAYVRWDGDTVWRRIQVIGAEGGALVGMSLLYGSRLVMDVVDGGAVTISPLSPR